MFTQDFSIRKVYVRFAHFDLQLKIIEDSIIDHNVTLSFQYHVGQLYMIAKHSSEESKQGEGVEVIENCPIDGNISLI